MASHGRSPDETEGAFYGVRVPAKAYDQRGERRYAFVGATDAGRIVTVIFTHRSGRVRIVTARDAAPNEKRRYRRR